ncbi:Holliday junction resolvase-like predicted endonuclease [Rhizobium mesoamericanum]|uniref:hypothetical protein n=1 Tax=Rhizobium mesoamericanum TaxID=1079800 RepID=UPI002789861D|nr:Holliday junction resolvase-like predicted endonuclease [Rhizobium mesoamericanum]
MGDKAAASGRHKALRGGYICEYLTAIYLMPKGNRIAALRYRTRLGEIGTIARNRNLAIFWT